MNINIKNNVSLPDDKYFEGLSRLSNISSLDSDDDGQISLRDDNDRYL